MICLSCLSKITASNRQTYKLGLRMPYCKDCVQGYITSKAIKEMSREQRSEFLKKTRVELEAQTFVTEEDLIDARIKLRKMGLTEEELKYILERVKVVSS